jgi:hypothetical protein
MTNVMLTKETVQSIINVYKDGVLAGAEGFGILSPYDGDSTLDVAWNLGVDTGVQWHQVEDLELRKSI